MAWNDIKSTSDELTADEWNTMVSVISTISGNAIDGFNWSDSSGSRYEDIKSSGLKYSEFRESGIKYTSAYNWTNTSGSILYYPSSVGIGTSGTVSTLVSFSSNAQFLYHPSGRGQLPYISTQIISGGVFKNFPFHEDFLIWISGSNFYARNTDNGELIYNSDASTLINDCISILNSRSRGGKIKFKTGTYNINTTINLEGGIILEGTQGVRVAEIEGTRFQILSNPGIKYNGDSDMPIGLSHIGFRSWRGTNDGDVLVTIFYGARSFIYDCSFMKSYGCDWAVLLSGAQFTHIENCYFGNFNLGAIKTDVGRPGGAWMPCNVSVIRGCQFDSPSRGIILHSLITKLVVEGCEFGDIPSGAIYGQDLGSGTGGPQACVIRDCSFEDCNPAFYLSGTSSSSPRGNIFESSYVRPGSNNHKIIKVDGSYTQNLTIRNIWAGDTGATSALSGCTMEFHNISGLTIDNCALSSLSISGCYGVTISNNDLLGDSPIRQSGNSRVAIYNNIGYYGNVMNTDVINFDASSKLYLKSPDIMISGNVGNGYIFGGSDTSDSLYLYPNRISTYPNILINGDTGKINFYNNGSEFGFYDQSNIFFSMYFETESKLYGQNITDTDMIIYANRIDDYPYIKLIGSGSIELYPNVVYISSSIISGGSIQGNWVGKDISLDYVESGGQIYDTYNWYNVSANKLAHFVQSGVKYTSTYKWFTESGEKLSIISGSLSTRINALGEFNPESYITSSNALSIFAHSTNINNRFYPSSLGSAVSGALISIKSWFLESGEKLSTISGSLAYRIGIEGGATQLSELSDVSDMTPTPGVHLVYDGDTGQWSSQALSISLTNLSDVTPYMTPQEGCVLTWDSSYNYWSSQLALSPAGNQFELQYNDGAGGFAANNAFFVDDTNLILKIQGCVSANSFSGNSINIGLVSNAEFGYLDGVTSAIQTQLNSKAFIDNYIASTTALQTFTGSSNVNINYLNNVSSNARLSYDWFVESGEKISIISGSLATKIIALTFDPEDYITSSNSLDIFADSSNYSSHKGDTTIHFTKDTLDDDYAGSSNINRDLLDSISGNLDARIDALGGFDATLYITSANALFKFAHSTNIDRRFPASSIVLAKYYPSTLGEGISGAVYPLTTWYIASSSRLSSISGNVNTKINQRPLGAIISSNFFTRVSGNMLWEFSSNSKSLFAHSSNINTKFVKSGVILTSLSSQSISGGTIKKHMPSAQIKSWLNAVYKGTGATVALSGPLQNNIGSNYIYGISSVKFVSSQNIFGEVVKINNLLVDSAITHLGDTDTSIGFLTNSISFYAGSTLPLALTTTQASVNWGGASDIDFVTYGTDANPLLYADAGLKRIGINTASPNYNLDVVGSIYADTSISSQKISSGIIIGDRINHGGDSDTYLNFYADNSFSIVVGNVGYNFTDPSLLPSADNFQEIGSNACKFKTLYLNSISGDVLSKFTGSSQALDKYYPSTLGKNKFLELYGASSTNKSRNDGYVEHSGNKFAHITTSFSSNVNAAYKHSSNKSLYIPSSTVISKFRQSSGRWNYISAQRISGQWISPRFLSRPSPTVSYEGEIIRTSGQGGGTGDPRYKTYVWICCRNSTTTPATYEWVKLAEST